MVPSLWMMWDSMCLRWKESPCTCHNPFYSDVRNSVTGRVKVLGYWLAAVVADVGQMFGKANHKGPGSLTNVDHFA